jgi:hypothetical protein
MRRRLNIKGMQFWKILNRFGKKGTDKNIKITIDQLYEYFKSLNENEELNKDEINLPLKYPDLKYL